jgi:phosphohistidine phosphatase
MKTIIVMRHAKSSWANPSQHDVERELNERGLRDAPAMGARLFNRKIHIDAIIASASRRTTQTAMAVAEQLQYPLDKINYFNHLYHASSETIQQTICSMTDEIQTALFICHNPGITFWANEQAEVFIDNMPTSGMIAFSVDITQWAQYATAKKEYLFFDAPKLEA